MVALAQQVSALIISPRPRVRPGPARSSLAQPVPRGSAGPDVVPEHPGGGGASLVRVPKRRSVAPRAADDDWEKMFADLKPLAPELSAAQVEVLERALARGRSAGAWPGRREGARAQARRRARVGQVQRAPRARTRQAVPAPAREGGDVVAAPRTTRLRSPRGRGIRDADGDDEREDDVPQTYLRNALGAKHVPKGAPAYKGYVKTRLGATKVATLEKVYASDTHPSDDMVESIRRATKLPRSKIVAWFKTRREEDKMAKRRAVRERYGGEEGYGRDERGGDGFYERRRGGRGGGRGGGGGLREGGAGDAYGARQERGRRDSTGEWSGRRG